MECFALFFACCILWIFGKLFICPFMFSEKKLDKLQRNNNGTLKGLSYNDFIKLGNPESETIVNGIKRCVWTDETHLCSKYIISIKFDKNDLFSEIIYEQRI